MLILDQVQIDEYLLESHHTSHHNFNLPNKEETDPLYNCLFYYLVDSDNVVDPKNI